MKVSIEIDCTPQEARRFFGLPDVEPMQEQMMQAMQEKMGAAMNMMDPESLARTWFPMGAQGLEQFQKILMGAARSAMQQPSRSPSRPSRPGKSGEAELPEDAPSS